MDYATHTLCHELRHDVTSIEHSSASETLFKIDLKYFDRFRSHTFVMDYVTGAVEPERQLAAVGIAGSNPQGGIRLWTTVFLGL